MKSKLVIFVTFLSLVLIDLHAGNLTIMGNRFYMDDRPFEMWGLRTASATQSEDLTLQLISNLDDYKRSGLNTISVYIQGSSGGFSDPFSRDGKTLDKDHADRLKRIVQECNKRGMVVIAGIFYQRVFQDENAGIRNLKNSKSVYNATRTVAELLKPYTNVIINIANEQNSGRYKEFEPFNLNDTENIIALCELIKEVNPAGYVGAGGYHDESNIEIGKSEYVDVLLFDTYSKDIDNHHTSGWHYDHFREQGVPDKPMVNVEIFGAWTRQAMPPGVYTDKIKKTHFVEIDEAIKRPGLSVHLHSNPWCQGPSLGDYPIHYELGGMGTAEDPGIRWWFKYAQSQSQKTEKSKFECIMIDSVGAVRPWGKCFGDLDGDGLTDLLIGGYVEGGLVYYQNPTWQKNIISDESGFSTDIEVFDIDGDNDLDVFCVRKNTIEWFENPEWTAHVVDSVGCHDLELGDLDGNGLIDIVARDQGEFGHRGDTIFIYHQLAPASWKGSKFICADGEGLKLYDINMDNRPDILINGCWFENTGREEQWEEHPFTDTWDFKSTYIDVGDINQDGRKDIVLSPSELAGMQYRISWFEAPAGRTGIWKEHIIEDDVEAVHHFVGIADFDLDGNPDVATAEMLQGEDPDEVKIFYNNGSGRNWIKQVISEAGCHSMRIMDIDSDGDMDLFGANHQDRKIRLWKNLILSDNHGISRERNLLTGKYSFDGIKNNIISQDSWKPFPDVRDRSAWEGLPEDIKSWYIDQGNKALGYSWPPLPATLFREFVINGNRSRYQAPYYERRNVLVNLVLAELMEGKNRFMDDILNGIWAICEESYWGVPAHLYIQRAGRGLPDVTEPTVDLFAAETGALLAWTDYLLGSKLDSISPLIRQRIYHEADRRILTPCRERDDFWWMGFVTLEEAGIHIERLNNWSPWINSNWLTTLLLLEKNDEKRIKSVYKIMKCVDHYMNPHPADGGCDEGPSYWNRAAGSLYDCLELFYSASGGEINIYDENLVREMGRYIYRAHIADNYYINFADAGAVLNIDPGLVYRYGRSIDDDTMMQFASSAAIRQEYGKPKVNGNLGRKLAGLFILEELNSTYPLTDDIKDVWLPDLQVLAARSGAKTEKDYYLAAKGGHNHESHNHNDVGNFIVYLNGMPVIIDVGVETYSRKTFDPEHRYEIWTMQSACHNLPTINGVMQKNGLEYRAKDVSFDADPNQCTFELNIAGAYPHEAGIDSYIRTIILNRGHSIEISDQYVLKEYKEPTTINLMTPMIVDTDNQGEISLKARDNRQEPVTIYYDKKAMSPTVERIAIKDKKLQNAWGEELTRIIFKVNSTGLEGKIKMEIR